MKQSKLKIKHPQVWMFEHGVSFMEKQLNLPDDSLNLCSLRCEEKKHLEVVLSNKAQRVTKNMPLALKCCFTQTLWLIHTHRLPGRSGLEKSVSKTHADDGWRRVSSFYKHRGSVFSLVNGVIALSAWNQYIIACTTHTICNHTCTKLISMFPVNIKRRASTR